MQTRYMERSNSIAREKRALDPSSTEEGQSDRKRPALARYFFLLPYFYLLSRRMSVDSWFYLVFLFLNTLF